MVNPAKLVDAPIVRDGRERRLEAGERDKLNLALVRTRNPLIAPIVTFAIETAMRRGEILNLKWHDVNTGNRTAHIPKTKTG
ncbi:tyrosine-type recombinase/integrase [Blastomonas fulva]|uniref:tyrosine-type recombinase/integrase n=1 Tax=Blastomonas fulva TaxID=1550728 RepID=UPI003F6F5ADC